MRKFKAGEKVRITRNTATLPKAYWRFAGVLAEIEGVPSVLSERYLMRVGLESVYLKWQALQKLDLGPGKVMSEVKARVEVWECKVCYNACELRIEHQGGVDDRFLRHATCLCMDSIDPEWERIE